MDFDLIEQRKNEQNKTMGMLIKIKKSTKHEVKNIENRKTKRCNDHLNVNI